MASSFSLTKQLDWKAVCNLLDLPFSAGTLPQQTICPWCRGTLHLTENSIFEGVWHYCSKCRRHGDLIELAAAVWNMSVEAACLRLGKEGLLECTKSDETVVKYVQRFPKRHQSISAFWQNAQAFLAHGVSAEINQLRTKFHLQSRLSKERWQAGPGRLLGAIHRREAEKTFYPKGPATVYKYESAYNSGCMNDRLFKGRGWNDVLVVPFYDQPEHICAFFFVGRRGTPEDMVFRSPWLFVRRKHREAGLAGLWTVEEAKGSLGKFYLATDDPLLAVRLQIRHYNTSSLPLPMVSYFDNGKYCTRETWNQLSYKTPVFWTPFSANPASVIHQAILSDGYISPYSFYRMREDQLDHMLRDLEPRLFVKRVLNKAKPWREAFAQWAEQASSGAVEEVLLRLENYGLDLEKLRGICEAIDAAMPQRSVARQVKVGRYTIVERDGMWWSKADRGEELILNAALRIDKVSVRTVHNRQVSCYCGYILYKGERIPFEIPLSVAERYGYRHLQDALAKAKGEVLYVASGWQKALFDAAKLFADPYLYKHH